MASIRSWLSEIITSTGSIPGSRRGTRAMSTSIPIPPLAAVSEAAQDSPPAPRSCTPTARPESSRARQASISFFSSNGSPTWTDGRLSAPVPIIDGSSKPAEARMLAPPMPSRPVEAPSSTARFPSPSARASTRRDFGSTPRQKTLISGLAL